MWVIHDIGGEFTGFAFQQLLCLLNIKLVPTTNKNPLANAICKCMHQTVATVLKNTFACPATTIMLSSNVTCGWCPDNCHAWPAINSFNYFASHTWMTCILLRHVSQHFSSCRFPCHSCMQRTMGQWCIALCQQKGCINFDYQIGQKVLKYGKTLQGNKPKTTGFPRRWSSPSICHKWTNPS